MKAETVRASEIAARRYLHAQRLRRKERLRQLACIGVRVAVVAAVALLLFY